LLEPAMAEVVWAEARPMKRERVEKRIVVVWWFVGCLRGGECRGWRLGWMRSAIEGIRERFVAEEEQLKSLIEARKGEEKVEREEVEANGAEDGQGEMEESRRASLSVTKVVAAPGFSIG
jgi:hypothetical protein